MHHMAHPGSRQNDHQFELTHPKPNSICVACGYLCLTLQGTYACKACNVPVHVECLTGVSRKPVPLCSPSGPPWTPPVASVETPPLMMPSTHPVHYAYNNPVPPMFSPYLYNHQGPPSQYYAYNYPPPMFPPYPYNHQGPPPQAPVMPTYPYPYPYPYNHPGNTQNTGNGSQQNNTQNTGNGNHQGNTQNAGNGNHQGNTQNAGNGNQQNSTQNTGNGKKQGTGKKILKTVGRVAVPMMIASVIGLDVGDLDLPFLSEEDQPVDE